MSLPTTPDPIVEYRGITGLVAARIIEDSAENYTTGDVFAIAGTATIEKTRESSSEAHYYDNYGAIVVSSEGADTITCTVSALPLAVYAELTGQYYDEATGALIEGETEGLTMPEATSAMFLIATDTLVASLSPP